MKVSIGVSNRHVHLSEDSLHALFGGNVTMEAIKPLKQPGQYASNLFVTVQTEKNKIEKVRVLGPMRDYTQVEISKTDAYFLGIDPPVRASGDLEGSSGVTLVGPEGSIMLEEGCILANRHIHMTLEQQIALGLQNVSEVCVRVSGLKGGILEHVQLKVAPNSYYEMHLDTDDANAFLLQNGDEGIIFYEDLHM